MLSGIAAIPGPPVVIYWLATALPVAVVRANLLTLFYLGEFVSLANIGLAGLFTRDAVVTGAWAAPVYFVGLLVGWRLFGLASERSYRTVTFGLIVAATLLALPALDGVFGLLRNYVAN